MEILQAVLQKLQTVITRLQTEKGVHVPKGTRTPFVSN
jgi:hypothetical protein